MREEPTTPGPLETLRGGVGAFNRRDLDTLVERDRPHGSSSVLERRCGFVATWRDGRIARAKNYLDLDQASTAAEQLAEERG